MCNILKYAICNVIFFWQEIRLLYPNSQRINRGNYETSKLVQACRANDVTDLILLHEHRGVPGNYRQAAF